MTVDDLMTLFQSARQGTRDWNGTEWVGVYGGDRAGVTAIVRALRDELSKCDWDEGENMIDALDEILGSDAGEKVAEGIAERADEQRADAPATDPIRDAAPAVCVWTSDVQLGDAYMTKCRRVVSKRWAEGRNHCSCGKPIKFTEVK